MHLFDKKQREPKKVKMKSNISKERLFDLGSLYLRLGEMSDLRSPQGLRYSLALILVLIVLAKLSGEDSPSGIAEWAQFRSDELSCLLNLKRKIMPHHSTYRRIMADVVDVDELELLTSDYLFGKEYLGKNVLISIDGKVLRGTLNAEQEGTYLLAAYLPDEGLVLLEVEVEGKGKEIPAALKLLRKLDLREKIVIGDALHTQRDASKEICIAGGDYIWYAKGNQGQLEEDIRLWFEPEPEPLPGQGRLPKDFENAQTVNKGHGRIDQRRITVSSQLNDFLDWPFLEQVFMLERRVTNTKTGEVRESVVYGVTSLARDKVRPDELLTLIRSYWGIENGLHYRRDVTLLEDRTRMTSKKAGHVMACINNLIVGLIIGKKKSRYLPTARRYFNAHLSEAFQMIGGL
jgi:predicted transposase YbfD/YdcC